MEFTQNARRSKILLHIDNLHSMVYRNWTKAVGNKFPSFSLSAAIRSPFAPFTAQLSDDQNNRKTVELTKWIESVERIQSATICRSPSLFTSMCLLTGRLCAFGGK